jgi:hypothetical protein
MEFGFQKSSRDGLFVEINRNQEYEPQRGDLFVNDLLLRNLHQKEH